MLAGNWADSIRKDRPRIREGQTAREAVEKRRLVKLNKRIRPQERKAWRSVCVVLKYEKSRFLWKLLVDLSKNIVKAARYGRVNGRNCNSAAITGQSTTLQQKKRHFRERPGAIAVTNKTGKVFLLQAQNKGALMSCRLHCTTDRRCLWRTRW